jgi:hypothetical protein
MQSSDWDTLGGGLSFGGVTIDHVVAATADTAYAIKNIPDIGGLRVNAQYSFKVNGDATFPDAYTNHCYRGVGIGRNDYNTGLAPALDTIGAIGGWVPNFGGASPVIGQGVNGGMPFFYGDVSLNTTFTFTTEIVVGHQTAGVYPVTVRTYGTSYSGAFDHTEIFSTGINNTSFTSGFIVIGGGRYLSTGEVFSLLSVSYDLLGDPAVDNGIAHGFTSWISIFEDTTFTGNTHTLPQALVVDSDNLQIGKEILVK